jgi:hypothetical protein
VVADGLRGQHKLAGYLGIRVFVGDEVQDLALAR